MTEELKAQNPTFSAPPPLRKRLVKAMFYGAIAGAIFSGPGGDLNIPEGVSLYSLAMTLLLIALLGLLAGIVLGFLESHGFLGSKTSKEGWAAVIKVPSMMIGGFLIICGVLAIPITIDVLARSGTEWLTGGAGNSVLRRVIGVLAGTCFGLVVLAVLLANASIRVKWRESRLKKEKSLP